MMKLLCVYKHPPSLISKQLLVQKNQGIFKERRLITNPSSWCIVHSLNEDSRQYEIDPEKAKEALKELDQKIQSVSSKQVSSPKLRVSEVKPTREETISDSSDLKPELRHFPSKVVALILHANQANKNAYKTLITAEYVGVEVQLVSTFQMGVSNKTPQFLKMNPIGKVPVLETPDGPIFESNAIARYVARLGENNLFGSSPIDQAHIDQWIDFSSFEIDDNIMKLYRPRRGFSPYFPPVEEAAISALKRAFEALNTHLAHNTYLVGDSVTLADIIATNNLYLGFTYLFVKSFTSEFPHVERYFWTLVNQPNFRKILGQVKQTEAMPPIPSAK